MPVSYIAQATLQSLWGPDFPTDVPRGDYGHAMISGWLGGFFLLTGGLLLIVSQLSANRLAEQPASFPSKLDFSRKLPFVKVDIV